MEDITGDDRDAVLALVTEALRDAGRTEPPPEAEQGDWLRGDAEWSEPDEHGWVALVPVRLDVWVPKAMVAWQVMLQSGGTVWPEWMDDPRLSLARWPAIEAAVRRLPDRFPGSLHRVDHRFDRRDDDGRGGDDLDEYPGQLAQIEFQAFSPVLIPVA